MPAHCSQNHVHCNILMNSWPLRSGLKGRNACMIVFTTGPHGQDFTLCKLACPVHAAERMTDGLLGLRTSLGLAPSRCRACSRPSVDHPSPPPLLSRRLLPASFRCSRQSESKILIRFMNTFWTWYKSRCCLGVACACVLQLVRFLRFAKSVLGTASRTRILRGTKRESRLTSMPFGKKGTAGTAAVGCPAFTWDGVHAHQAERSASASNDFLAFIHVRALAMIGVTKSVVFDCS